MESDSDDQGLAPNEDIDQESETESGEEADINPEPLDPLLFDRVVEAFVFDVLESKVARGLTQQAVNDTFEVVRERLGPFLPQNLASSLPRSFDQALKLVFPMLSFAQRLEVCRYECTIFTKDAGKLNFCPKCKTPRSQPNGKPWLVFRYIPLADRLRHLYSDGVCIVILYVCFRIFFRIRIIFLFSFKLALTHVHVIFRTCQSCCGTHSNDKKTLVFSKTFRMGCCISDFCANLDQDLIRKMY
jgi:hypothetical protein